MVRFSFMSTQTFHFVYTAKMGDCSSCTCNNKDSEVKTEVEIIDNPTKNLQETPSFMLSPEIYLKLNLHIDKIIKIQALFRGHKDRKIVSHLIKNQRTNAKYFTHDESRETLSSKLTTTNLREDRPPYRFKSGAVYTGQWKGGFRDGHGLQV